MKKIILFLLIAFLATELSFAQESAKDTVKIIKPVAVPAGFTSKVDLVYTGGKDWNMKMDLYVPPKTIKLAPVLISIHGGGWNHGQKEGQGGFDMYFKQGYAVANIEYRLTPQATAPAAVEDARCALIYLIKNAKELGLDPSKIVIRGGSSGGHLALLAGLLADNHTFDTNCPNNFNIKVAAILVDSEIADFEQSVKGGYGMKVDKSAINWLGDKAKDPKFIAAMSPMNYISKDSPPMFIVHGDQDARVSYQHSVNLHKKLQKFGVKSVFITVEGGGHGVPRTKEKKKEIDLATQSFLKEINLMK